MKTLYQPSFIKDLFAIILEDIKILVEQWHTQQI